LTRDVVRTDVAVQQVTARATPQAVGAAAALVEPAHSAADVIGPGAPVQKVNSGASPDVVIAGSTVQCIPVRRIAADELVTARSAYEVILPPAPRIRSLPAPPLPRSAPRPAPPRITSGPALPRKMSLPSPLARRSLLPPPTKHRD
jgi:hypothetical protein